MLFFGTPCIADEDTYSSTLDNDFAFSVVHGMTRHELHMVDVDDNVIEMMAFELT